jgi:YegS/Rv2252/BmrU family lipid kinase
MAKTDGQPDILEFLPDLTSKKKKGVHKPIYAKVFTKDIVQGEDAKVIHLMVNPFSGKKKGQKIAAQAKLMFEERSIKVETHLSSYSGELIELTSKLTTDESDIIAVVGGDGSLSEVVTGLMQAKKTCRVGLIPAGTGNSMANDLKITSTEEAVSRICYGHYQSLDLAKVDMVAGLPGNENGVLTRYSINLVTWGLGVDSTIKAEKMRWMGPMRYDVGILMAIMANNRRNATLTIDGNTIEDDFTLFLIQNSQTGGSMLPLAPGASLDDGVMDIGILKKMKRGQILKAFGQLKKEGRHVFHPMVDYHRFRTLEISTPRPTAINVDGENIGSTPLKMEVMQGALRFIHNS